MFIVGGTFDKNGGKPSRIVAMMMELLEIHGVNGGYLSDLDIDFKYVSELIWMPNIDNSEDKILPSIKVNYPHMLLIQSKRISAGNYTESDVIGRLLKSRSLLGITIEKKSDKYEFQLLDPLGNTYCKTRNVKLLCNALKRRVNEIKPMNRVASTRIGPMQYFSVDERFIEIVKNFGKQFATFVNAINPNRLLGNASTRCAVGFPAVRESKSVYVSKRNVDKQTLSSKDFVEVSIKHSTDTGEVAYRGANKPSVDTPIQLALFLRFPNIKYMIHGHVYVEGAPMTQHKIPCGFLEEVDDVVETIKDPNLEEFSVNLRGHGCLIACKDLAYFDTVKLEGRPFPET